MCPQGLTGPDGPSGKDGPPGDAVSDTLGAHPGCNLPGIPFITGLCTSIVLPASIEQENTTQNSTHILTHT